MNTVDTIVVIIVVIAGGAIFYKALKEPIDLMLGGIWRLLVGAKDKLSGGGTTYSDISYG